MSLGATLAAACGGLLVFAAADLATGLRLPRRRRRPRLPRVRGVFGALPAVLPAPATLPDRVAAAGRPGGLAVRDWMALKLACAVAGALVAVLLGGALPDRLRLAATLAAPPAAFLVPDYRLAQIGRRRSEAALRELPGMLDLLRVTVEAGSPPIAAMGLIGERFDGPLAVEWRTAAAEVALGIPHETALAALSRRLPADGVRTLVDALTSANRVGLPLADSLAAQAAAARHARARQIREHAARAAPQMQLVVALVLVPSVMLTIAAVLAAELTRDGLGFGY